MPELPFAKPLFLLGLVVVPLFLWLRYHALTMKLAALKRFLLNNEQNPALSPNVKIFWLRALTIALALAAMIVALAQPQWGTSVEDTPRRGRDVVVLLDVSLSMLASDAKPSRLEQAKIALTNLVDTVGKDGGHRLALLPFSGSASVRTPLTLDYAFFLQRLADVGPHVVVRKGTALGDALRKVTSGLNDLAHEFTDVIILSDGEDHGSFALDAARAASRRGIALHTVGIGDPHSGAKIPLPGGADGEYLSKNDQDVITRARPELLLEIATIGSGTFLSAYTRPVDLVDLYNEHIADKPKRAILTGSSEGLAHRFQWFVLLAIVAMLVEQVLRSKPKFSTSKHAGASLPAGAKAALLVITTGLAISGCEPDDDIGQQLDAANALYSNGEYALAQERYTELSVAYPRSPHVQYNLATTYYKRHQPAAAIEHYLLALNTDEPELASRTRYNLGNTLYRQGVQAMLTFQDALTPLNAAAEHYRESLSLDPSFSDAEYNLELANRLIEEVQAQLVRAQENAEIRNQQTSRNEGQDFDSQSGEQDRPESDDKKDPDANKKPQGEQGEQAPGAPGAAETSLQSQSVGKPKDMSPEEAEQLVELARSQADASKEQRDQWRNARMRDKLIEKDW